MIIPSVNRLRLIAQPSRKRSPELSPAFSEPAKSTKYWKHLHSDCQRQLMTLYRYLSRFQKVRGFQILNTLYSYCIVCNYKSKAFKKLIYLRHVKKACPPVYSVYFIGPVNKQLFTSVFQTQFLCILTRFETFTASSSCPTMRLSITYSISQTSHSVFINFISIY